MSQQTIYEEYGVTWHGFLVNEANVDTKKSNNNSSISFFDVFGSDSLLVNLFKPENYEALVNHIKTVPIKTKEEYEEIVNNIDDYAMLLQIYTRMIFIIQKYLYGDNNDIKKVIPYNIGYVTHLLANKLGTVMSMTYTTSVLCNNVLDVDVNVYHDEEDKYYGDDIKFIMTGEFCEVWFYKIHVEIEKKIGQSMYEYIRLSRSSKYGHDEVIDFFRKLNNSIVDITKIMMDLQLLCSSDQFYNVIRLYLKGYEDVTIEDTDIVLNCMGGSGAQNCFTQVLDNLLEINHDKTHEEEYLLGVRKYMTKKNRKLLEDMQYFPRIKNFIGSVNKDKMVLLKLYDEIVSNYAHFRKVHLGIVHKYIKKSIGTGGTTPDVFLGNIIKRTNDKKIFRNKSSVIMTKEQKNESFLNMKYVVFTMLFAGTIAYYFNSYGY